MTAVDKLTVRFVTERAHPLLPNDLVSIRLIPAKLAASVKTEEFNSGKAVIGTGPYKFKEYVAGDRVVLERNEAYWGPKPHWKTVRMRMITNSAARVATLLAGDVQMIEAVPTGIARLSKDGRVSVASAVSNRLIYYSLDSDRAVTPFATGKDGKPLDKNPFKDVRVRKAISLALDRDAIVSRIMEGQAQPLPASCCRISSRYEQEAGAAQAEHRGSAQAARQAGYPNGFAVTLHSPNNRYINDEKVAQAVAASSRAGIDTRLEAMPSNVFFSRAGKLEFSFFLAGWGAETGETSSPLRTSVRSARRPARPEPIAAVSPMPASMPSSSRR